MTEKVILDPAELSHFVIDVASEKQASDIVLLDIRSVSDFTDFFVILTAESTRQMRVLAEDIEHALRRVGGEIHHREGNHQSGWMLLDFGDLVIHLFGPEEREFYNIEDAWAEATEVVRVL